uniref:Uncharacterized protein n=1 Tax=Candidatus Kentrum sp. FM TaxID=2126340 RepID=A0A450S1R4_9GAMM|nr:MAG: hypothetical protein BECKFM1743A_GA0114220_100273 [Candidatus Kentron sp. FM]VFJ49424.1 MAG: hypothetical protein BECKFM1743C_GA0114222_100713 [Candidatus Kentron sp. FM]VFK19440.1 MAG: hypothetical protein BECKFM1743B_GA0114221_106202 [Candidatus Kentron sp. FM]
MRPSLRLESEQNYHAIRYILFRQSPRFSPEKISHRALSAYQAPENAVFLSLVSVWEIQIKQQLGKLELDVSLGQLLDEQREHNAIHFLPIELSPRVQLFPANC